MIQKQIGENIKALRLAKGYSQESFATKCGLHRTYIAGVETGRRNISLENLNKIAEALEVTLSTVCSFDEPIHNNLIMKVNDECFILETNCELTPKMKDEIDIIAKLVYDEDESSLGYELSKEDIDSVYDATDYDIAEAMRKAIESRLNINLKFKAIDAEVIVNE